ncbi:MAG: quinol:cytochrome C oxidoreductase [Cytophagales bacterium]|nr:quinol:cytochrome C oxidoreductase [Cytophagales bacterium]
MKSNLVNTGTETFEFTNKAKKNLMITMVVGLVLSIVGVVTNMGAGNHEETTDGGHDATEMVTDQGDYGESVEVSEGGAAEHHGSPLWLKSLYNNLWINTIYFAGLALLGVFFFTIQYAAQAGWSAGIKRIPLAFGAWLPIAFGLIAILFFLAGPDLFHWTHSSLYDVNSEDFDEIVKNKASYFYWPMEAGSFPAFWVGRLVLFFGVWYLLFRKLRTLAFEEDIEGGESRWKRMRILSALFLVFFAYSSSIAAWDWVMSIDVHWFSTMYGWYSFASWWVACLALTTFLIIYLKENGYLSIVNTDVLHDMGKFVFAFSIFWTYLWFSQFMLIYYAHIPEETVYYMDRWTGKYSIFFFLNLIINFILPFFMLMTHGSKRQNRILKSICVVIILGHWLDFYLMITPGVMKYEGGFGFMEVGLLLVFLSSFLFVVLRQIAKAPLFASNHPMLEESKHHHV